MPKFDALAAQMLDAALAASHVILDHYQGHIVVERKDDGSPVTAADAAGEAIIIEKLAGLDVPILGEESVADGKIPTLGERFFLSSTHLMAQKNISSVMMNSRSTSR